MQVQGKALEHTTTTKRKLMIRFLMGVFNIVANAVTLSISQSNWREQAIALKTPFQGQWCNRDCATTTTTRAEFLHFRNLSEDLFQVMIEQNASLPEHTTMAAASRRPTAPRGRRKRVLNHHGLWLRHGVK
jgi:hypothetical protein